MKKTLLFLAIAILVIGCTKFEDPPVNTPQREVMTRAELVAVDMHILLNYNNIKFEKRL